MKCPHGIDLNKACLDCMHVGWTADDLEAEKMRVFQLYLEEHSPQELVADHMAGRGAWDWWAASGLTKHGSYTKQRAASLSSI